MFARHSAPDYPPFCIPLVSVFLNSVLFWMVSTVQWWGATSICDGIFCCFRLQHRYAQTVWNLMKLRIDVTGWVAEWRVEDKVWAFSYYNVANHVDQAEIWDEMRVERREGGTQITWRGKDICEQNRLWGKPRALDQHFGPHWNEWILQNIFPPEFEISNSGGNI